MSWTAVTEPNATYIVDESTTADFSGSTSSPPTSSLSATFSHSVTTSTIYYYRVHATTCGGAVGTNSIPVAVVVQPVPTVSGRQGDVTVPLGSACGLE